MSQSSLRTRGIAAGIAAIAASALAAGVMAAPAQAHDKGNGTSDASHSKDHNTLGEKLYSTKTIKLTDGTIVAKNSRKGSITALDATTVTVTSLDGTVAVYTPAANTKLERNDADVSLSAFLVGDAVKVKSRTVSAIETVIEIEAEGVVVPPVTPAPTASSEDSNHNDSSHSAPEVKFNDKGEAISSISTYKKVDGTFATVAKYYGVVASVSDVAVTVTSADGASTAYTVGAGVITRDRVAATLAQLVAGDRIRIAGTLAASVLTVTNVDAISAAAWASRDSHPEVKDQAVVTKSNAIKAERIAAKKLEKAKKLASKKAPHSKKSASSKKLVAKKNK